LRLFGSDLRSAWCASEIESWIEEHLESASLSGDPGNTELDPIWLPCGW
jgi:hypothetical protein